MSVAISADDRKLAAIWYSGKVQLWRLNELQPEVGAEGAELSFDTKSGNIWNSAFTADGERLLTSGFREPLVCWNIATGQKEWSMDAPESQNFIRAFPGATSTTKNLLVAGMTGMVALWDTTGWKDSQTGKKPLGEPACSRDPFMIPVLSSDGKRLITLSGSNWLAPDKISVWNIESLPKPEAGDFDGQNSPSWLASLAEAVSGIGEQLDDMGPKPPTLASVYQAFSKDPDTMSGQYSIIWKRFFPRKP